MTRVNLNGRIVPPERAHVSVFDRGFLYGDSVYEVLRTYGGAPFALGDHLRRLHRSADLLGIRIPRTDAWIRRQLARTLAAARNRESYIRIVVTRGAGRIGLDPALARRPQVILIVKALEPPPPALYRKGVRVELVRAHRELTGSSQPAAKSGNYLHNVLALREARAHGAYEAILVDALGRLCEGSSSNLFVVWRGALLTPPLKVGILEGITRGRVIRLAREMGLEVREVELEAEDLRRADEAFITSSVREVLPVTGAAQRPGRPWKVGDGRPGTVTLALRSRFHDRAREEALDEWRRWGKVR